MSHLKGFLIGSVPGCERTLVALASAECLTDEIATDIYNLIPVEGLEAEDFLRPFKYSGLTEPRNGGEWSMLPSVWKELQQSNALETELRISIHQYLLGIGQDQTKESSAGNTFPSYLFTPAGKAYHYLCIGHAVEFQAQYKLAKIHTAPGVRWLAKQLLTKGWNPYRRSSI